MTPTVTDRTPLLANGGSVSHHDPFSSRLSSFFKAEGQPSWITSYKYLFFGSWWNIFLFFVPLSVLAHKLAWDATVCFWFSFCAIIPLAKLLGDLTDELSSRLGQTIAGLLNASFGNAVEIIVGIAALLQGELRIVQTSMLGSILSNILLVLGCSFVAGGLKYSESHFHKTAAQASSSLMTLSCITLVIPAAYYNAKLQEDKCIGKSKFSLEVDAIYSTPDPTIQHGLLTISRGAAVILLAVYVVYLLFQLKSHSYMFQAHDDEERETKMSTVSAASALLLVTVVIATCADYLVASIEETATRYNVPKTFIGLILLPIVANAAEHATSIWMAMKNKMELTISICVGSSIQISTFVVPLLVVIGWISGHELTLFFANFETIVLFVSVLLVNLLVQDGKSNYMEGVMLLALYILIALAFWVS